MRVPNRLAVSVAAVAAGASLLTAGPAFADDTATTGTTDVSTSTELLVPGAPTGLVAIAGDGMATVTFAPAPEGGAAANYEYSLDGGLTWLPMGDLTASSATALVTGLANGETYSISLRGSNAAGVGPGSQAVSVTLDAAAPPVEAPAPVVTEAPAPVVTEEPAPVVTEEPAPVVTEEPAPVVTEEPAPVVTEAPVVVAAEPTVAAAAAEVVTTAETSAEAQAAYDLAVREAVAAKWRAEAAARAEAIRQAVAAKWRYEAAVREAVAAKWRYEAAVRAAVAAKWRQQAAAAAAANTSNVARAAMNNALSRVGAPYIWGGQGPWGFDCSGLVAWAFRTAGYNMPGGSYNQWNYGRFISYSQLLPGDLVFYGPGGSQHVAIYIGNGQVVQASNYNTGVHIASVWYIGSPSGYKRI